MAFMKSIANDLKQIEDRITTCQIDLHKDFVHRDEYAHQIDKIEKMLDQIYTILREGKDKKWLTYLRVLVIVGYCIPT